MKCNSCSSHMILQRTESGSNSSSEWYHCSFCGKVRLTCSKIALAPDYLNDEAQNPLVMAAEETALSSRIGREANAGLLELEALAD